MGIIISNTNQIGQQGALLNQNPIIPVGALQFEDSSEYIYFENENQYLTFEIIPT